MLDALLTNFTTGDLKYELTIWVIDKPTLAGTSQFQRYLVHCKPAAESSLNIRGTLHEKAMPIESIEDVKKFIKIDQINCMILPVSSVDQSKFKHDQNFMAVTDERKNGVHRYSLHVVDADNSDLDKKDMGCFVVPLGLEREMKILDLAKQKEIRAQTQFARLVIVLLGRGHKYDSLQQI